MLLRGLPGNCTFEYFKEADIIKPITNNHVVVVSKHETLLNSTCGVMDRKITGKLLIEFHNCTIMLNGSLFTRKEFIYSEKPFVLPLHGLKISEIKLEKPVTIEDLQIENRHHLTALTQNHKQHVIATYGISISSIILGLIIVIYLLKTSNFRVRIFNRQIENISPINTDPSTQPTSTHRDVASSGGGVVKAPLPLVRGSSNMETLNRSTKVTPLPVGQLPLTTQSPSLSRIIPMCVINTDCIKPNTKP